MSELRLAGDAARHRVERPRRQLRSPGAEDRRRGRVRRAARAADRDVLDRVRVRRRGLRVETDGWAVVAVPRRAGHASTACGSAARARRSIPTRPPTTSARRTASCSPAPTARSTATARSIPSRTPARSGSCAPATELVTVDVEGFRVSMFVCYDLRFADEFWQLGGRHRPVPRAGQLAGEATRALDGAADGAGDREPGVRRRRQPRRRSGGEGGTLTYSGDSRIVDPTGEVLATASRSESILLADISTDRVAEIRDHFRFLPDRR